MRTLAPPLAAALVALALLNATSGSATSLAVTAGQLAATALPVVICDPAVAASWTTEYNAGLDTLTVDLVSLTGLDEACDGQIFQVTLADGSNAALGSDTYLDPAGPAGQIDNGGGPSQTVVFDLSGQDVIDSEVALVAWSVVPGP